MVLRFFIIGILFVLVVGIVQVCAMVWVSRANNELEPTELIVIYSGFEGRVAAAAKLVEARLGEKMMQTGIPDRVLKAKMKKRQVPSEVVLLDGGVSRSTVEDAYRTVRMIQEHGLKSVTIVTSSYHVPRSLLLLRAMMLVEGTKAEIQYHHVAEVSSIRQRWQKYHNEGVKLYGSLAELSLYAVTGKLPLNFTPLRKMKDKVKRYILFS